MLEQLITIVPLIAPALLLSYALAVKTGFHRHLKLQLGSIGIIGIVVSILCALLTSEYSVIQTSLLGMGGLGFSLRLDTLSTSIFIMIAILGFIILRFSSKYMEGDPKKDIFFSRLAITIAAVELLVLSGNLFQLLFFWIITSICLHYLLTFYRNRPQAIAAARKKFIVARLGDACLMIAVCLLYFQFGTGQLDVIFLELESTTFNMNLGIASVLLVSAALFKSAQFPTHGWLIEVVETPTPVSALLHAGLLNAGPFLMVRMSHLLIESTAGNLLLIIVGGFTALFASVVYMTQSSVKTSLGYSSVAHMGFSLLLCGFGVYSAALLHIVSHSFYKAHAFLTSSSLVDSTMAYKVKLEKRMSNGLTIVLGTAISIGIFTSCCWIWGINPYEEFHLMATEAVIIMGLSQLIIQALRYKKASVVTLMVTALAFGVSWSFLFLENGARIVLGNQIPALSTPPPIIAAATWILLTIYCLTLITQWLALERKAKWTYALGIHLRNGLYANVLFDRMIGSLKKEKFKWANLTIREDHENIINHFVIEDTPKKENEVLLNEQ